MKSLIPNKDENTNPLIPRYQLLGEHETPVGCSSVLIQCYRVFGSKMATKSMSVTAPFGHYKEM